jgi:hypothetical protein
MATDPAGLIEVLARGDVAFVVIGGVAANLHGALRTTLDLDIVYDRSPDNIERLVAALAPLKPYLRGAPAGLPFVLDAATVTRGLNFTLVTDRGDLDLLGDVAGGNGFSGVDAGAETVRLGEVDFRLVSLPKLIHLKRAAGRAKDREALAELEALLEERER